MSDLITPTQPVFRNVLASPMSVRGAGVEAELATQWDGTNDWAAYSTTPTNLSTTGPAFTMSFFFRCDSSGIFHGIYGTPTSTHVYVLVRSVGSLHLQVRDTAGSLLLNHVNVGPTDLHDGNVHHVIFGLDRLGNKTQLVIDGTTRVNTTYPTANDVAIMGATMDMISVTGFKFHGAWWEVWADDTAHDVVTNLTTWRAADGSPADLGSDGSAPGAQPVIYYPDGNPADNKGSGGNATITGAPTQIVRPT